MALKDSLARDRYLVTVAVNMDTAEAPASTAMLAAMLLSGLATVPAPPFNHHLPVQFHLRLPWPLHPSPL